MDERPTPRRANPVITLLSIAFFLMFAGAAQQQFQSPFWNNATDWPPARRSLILAVVYLSMGFWRLRIGSFIRAWGEKAVLLLGAATYVLFCLGVYATTNYTALLIIAACWGWGGAANWGTSSVMVLDATKDERYGSNAGQVQGATRLGFALGVVALSVVFNRGIAGGDPLGGRLVWLWAAVFTALGVAVLTLLPRREVDIDPPSWSEQWAMMRSTKGAIGSLFLFLGGSGFGVMLGILADVLAEFGGGSKLSIAALFSLAGGLAVYIGGPLSDRFGRPKALLVTFAVAAVGLLLAGAFPASLLAMMACAVLLGMQGGLVPTLTLAMIGDAATSQRRQNAYGALFFWRDMGVAASLLVAQWLRQQVSVQVSLLVMAGLSVVCAMLSVVLGRRAEERL